MLKVILLYFVSASWRENNGLLFFFLKNFTFLVEDRAQFGSLILKFGPNLVDPRGRLLPRSYDVLGDVYLSSLKHVFG